MLFSRSFIYGSNKSFPLAPSNRLLILL